MLLSDTINVLEALASPVSDSPAGAWCEQSRPPRLAAHHWYLICSDRNGSCGEWVGFKARDGRNDDEHIVASDIGKVVRALNLTLLLDCAVAHGLHWRSESGAIQRSLYQHQQHLLVLESHHCYLSYNSRQLISAPPPAPIGGSHWQLLQLAGISSVDQCN